MGSKSRIDLLIPGLFGPVPVRAADLPDLRALEKLLGRADRLAAKGRDSIALLFDRFGIEIGRDQDPPSAPFSRLADAPDADPSGFWLHADPVHLRPDRDRLLLFDARHLGLKREEADSLVGLFNGHFAADGLHLEAPATDRWYLCADKPPRMRASALSDVVGRSIERSSLRGEDASEWMRWLNEAQMLFHHSDVNQRRERAGRPTVSGIWPWGGGSLPASMPASRCDSVLACAPLAVGLARAVGVDAHPIPEMPDAIPAVEPGGRMLLYWDTLWPAVLDGDGAAWIRELSRFEKWLGMLTDWLRRGELGELSLFPCDETRLRATRGVMRRFWRRPTRIAASLKGKVDG